MKTLRNINWRAAWWATKWLCGVWGAIVLLAWFAAWPGFLLALPAAALFSVIWYGLYKFDLAIVYQKSCVAPERQIMPNKHKAGAAPNTAAPVPPIEVTADAVSALVNLGYMRAQARIAVLRAEKTGACDFEGIFREAQQFLRA